MLVVLSNISQLEFQRCLKHGRSGGLALPTTEQKSGAEISNNYFELPSMIGMANYIYSIAKQGQRISQREMYMIKIK
jgi:hypothetical protein